MAGFLLLAATLALATAGFALIAVSQKQHWRLVRPSGPAAPTLLLRLGGGLLIAVSTVPAVLRDGPAFGLLIWVTVISVAAALVVVWLRKRQE